MKLSRCWVEVRRVATGALLFALTSGCLEKAVVTGVGCFESTRVTFNPPIEWRGDLVLSLVGEDLDETCTLDFETARADCDGELMNLWTSPLQDSEDPEAPRVIDELSYIELPISYKELTLTISGRGKQLYGEKLVFEQRPATCDRPEHSLSWSEIEIDAGLPAPPVIGAGGSGGAGGGPSSP